MRREWDSADCSDGLLEMVREAIGAGTPLAIRGGGTKPFLGRLAEAPHQRPIDIRDHCGIVDYDPTELVITARAGTRLAELEGVLDENNQMLACEPPSFDGNATVGGMVAAGLSGPRRPWAGSVRDYVLGCRVITGHGKHLRFGGQVMKNVAGFDVSRLMTGSLGCLGLITEVSLKVVPKPRATLDLTLEMSDADALSSLAQWRREGLPLAGACHVGGQLRLRLEGGTSSVRAARERLGGTVSDGVFWADLRAMRLPFFARPEALWRLSVPASASIVALHGAALLDWGGMQRWIKTDAPAETVRATAHALGGHATCFTPGITDEPFHPLPPALLNVHRQLKAQLDPRAIFNPGRLYATV